MTNEVENGAVVAGIPEGGYQYVRQNPLQYASARTRNNIHFIYMKIFEIGTGYTSIPAKMGAATEIVVEELTRSLRKQGHDVTIVDIKDCNRQANDLPITEVYMPQFFSSTDVKLGALHKLKRVLYSISLTRKLHTLIRQCRDKKIVLHFHNQYNLFFFLKLTPKSMRERVTIAYTVHSYIWFGKWEDIKDIIKKRYFQEVYCCQHSDKVFVLNDIVKDMLQQHYGVNSDIIVKILNGVNVDVYNNENANQTEVERLRSQYGLQGKKVVIQIGSVCDRKNQLGTLKLLLPLMRQDSNLFMIYAGGIIDPVYQNEIRATAEREGVKDRVIYLGEVAPGKQLNNLYALADVAFINSKSESFALVIAEALSARKPIFICEEIMRSLDFWGKKEGKGIVRIKSTFEADLKRMLTDNAYYKEMQEAGRKFIVDEFSWDVAAKAYVEDF